MSKIDSAMQRRRVCYATSVPRRGFAALSDVGFRENPTGNNGDVFRDPAGGPLTPAGHLRDSATTSAVSPHSCAAVIRTVVVVVSTFQKRQCFTVYIAIVNLLTVARRDDDDVDVLS